MRSVILLLMVLCAGCSTQYFKSAQPASVVARCIANEWEHCGSPDFKVPVFIKQETNGYFVGVSMPSVYFGPSCPVWAEVTNTASGSVTRYHRELQIFHGRLDRAVQKCQDANNNDDASYEGK